MTAKLLSAWGYQGDAMNLPVADVDAAAPYYVAKMGFEVVTLDGSFLPSRPPDTPPNQGGESDVRQVGLERDGVRMGLAENGGDPTQDGCAFETDDVEALHAEFEGRGLAKLGELKDEVRKDGSRFRVFFVIAPDGLCFWFGQRLG